MVFTRGDVLQGLEARLCPGDKSIARKHGGTCCRDSPIWYVMGLFTYFVGGTGPTNSTHKGTSVI